MRDQRRRLDAGALGVYHDLEVVMLDREDWLYLGLFVALMTFLSVMVWAGVEWVF